MVVGSRVLVKDGEYAGQTGVVVEVGVNGNPDVVKVKMDNVKFDLITLNEVMKHLEG